MIKRCAKYGLSHLSFRLWNHQSTNSIDTDITICRALPKYGENLLLDNHWSGYRNKAL